MREEIFSTKDGAIIAECNSDDDWDMGDIDEEPINPLPQNWKADPREAPESINKQQQIRVTRNLLFARKLQLVDSMECFKRLR